MLSNPSAFDLVQVWNAIGRIGMKRGFRADHYVIAKSSHGKLARLCTVPAEFKNAREVKLMVEAMGDKAIFCFPVFKSAVGQLFPSDAQLVNLIVLEKLGSQQHAKSLCVGA